MIPRTSTRRLGALVASAVLGATLALAGCGTEEPDVTVGLITKQEENTYWVTMREIAETTADDENAELIWATGSSDVDVETQRQALESMIADDVDGILIAPNSSTDLLPEIQAARDAGIIVIAVDTPVTPIDATNAYFGTDNHEAGRLVGEYAAARAADLGLEPRIAMLNLAPGISSGEDRRDGFLEGFGITEDDPALVASEDSEGDFELGRSAMETILQDHPDVTVVYAVNEPAMLGALEALNASNVNPNDIVLVTVDGSCAALREGVRPGVIDATAMQFPENMAREGVRAIVDAARGAQAPSGYLDTGVQLISGHPVDGVESRNVEYGIRNCWGS